MAARGVAWVRGSGAPTAHTEDCQFHEHGWNTRCRHGKLFNAVGADNTATARSTKTKPWRGLGPLRAMSSVVHVGVLSGRYTETAGDECML